MSPLDILGSTDVSGVELQTTGRARYKINQPASQISSHLSYNEHKGSVRTDDPPRERVPLHSTFGP